MADITTNQNSPSSSNVSPSLSRSFSVMFAHSGDLRDDIWVNALCLKDIKFANVRNTSRVIGWERNSYKGNRQFPGIGVLRGYKYCTHYTTFQTKPFLFPHERFYNLGKSMPNLIDPGLVTERDWETTAHVDGDRKKYKRRRKNMSTCLNVVCLWFIKISNAHCESILDNVMAY